MWNFIFFLCKYQMRKEAEEISACYSRFPTNTEQDAILKSWEAIIQPE